MGSRPASRSDATTFGKCAGSIARMSRPTDCCSGLPQARLDRPGDLVAGGQLVHEPLARDVVQRRALTAYGLGDEKALASGKPDDGGRMELQQLEIRKRRADGVGQQQPDSL